MFLYRAAAVITDRDDFKRVAYHTNFNLIVEHQGKPWFAVDDKATVFQGDKVLLCEYVVRRRVYDTVANTAQ